MAISGKVGNVYSSALLVEDCEDVWTTGGAGRAVSIVTGKVGVSCARVITTDIGAGILLQYESGLTLDLTLYEGIYCWMRSSITTTAGNLQIRLDDAVDFATPLESLNLPALTAATWKQCFARLASPCAGITAVGLWQVTDLANGDFDVDDVQALKEIDGIKSWTLDYTSDTLDATDFDDAGIKAHIVGGSSWSGSFEGYKDGVPLGIGSEVYLTLGESATAYQNWLGKVIITGAHPNTSADGIVTYAYDYLGTGALEMPSA